MDSTASFGHVKLNNDGSVDVITSAVEHPATPNALAAMRARADQSLAADLQTLETRFIRLARPAR